jgi:hypothetical protein
MSNTKRGMRAMRLSARSRISFDSETLSGVIGVSDE